MVAPTLFLDITRKAVGEPNGQEKVLFQDTHFTLDADEASLAIRGRSGSGKTTLLKMLAGLDATFQGNYHLRGELLPNDVKQLSWLRRECVGYITQDPTLLRGRTIIDNVLLGLPREVKWRRVAGDVLERVGVHGWNRKKVDRLSGGEAQRVSVARALVRGPRVVLADEPTGSLDEETEQSVLRLFLDLQNDGVQFVIATHSPAVSGSCSRTIEIIDKELRGVPSV